MSEKINVLIGANIEGLKTALAESGKSLSDFGTLAEQTPKRAKTALDQLNQSYRDAVRDAKNLALMQGQTSEAFYEAQLKAKNLKAEIEGLNIVVGQTGQIAGGSGGIQQATNKFNMLGHSVNQLTREMPAFSQSMTTGFMAISNNIPMLVDQITEIKKANAGLVASGQPVQSVFSQLSSAIFSWNTAISLGITALTIFGPKLIEMLVPLKETAAELDAAKNAMKAYNDEINKFLYSEQELAVRRLNESYQNAKQKIENEKFIAEMQMDITKRSGQQISQEEIKNLNDLKSKLLVMEQNYLKQLSELKKSHATKDLKDLKNESFDLPNTPLILPIQPKFELAKLKADFKPIKLENFIDTTNAMTGFDRFKMNFLSALDDIEARVGKWSDLLANSLSTAISGAGSAFMSDDKDKWKNYGKMLLGLLGDIAIQIGGALMAMGIPMAAALIPMGFVYIASGAALLLAGGMLKAGSVPSQSNANSGGSQPNNSMSGGGGDIPSFNPTGMMISIDGLVRGNNIVVALDNQTRMNRRVR
jgi:hypothetical protein